MTRDLLFEIGVEELPAGYISHGLYLDGALAQLQFKLGTAFARSKLTRTSPHILVYGTPRRLVAIAPGVPSTEEDSVDEVLGPSAQAAFGPDGQPTRALLGFCAGKNVDPAEARVVRTTKGDYVQVSVNRPGRPAVTVLSEMLSSVAKQLVFPKTMRWLEDDTRFARPVRWMVALLGDEEIPVHAFGLSASKVSQGHRFLSHGPIAVGSTGTYVGDMLKSMVVVNHQEREESIQGQLDARAMEIQGHPVEDPELLEINTFQVEWPTVYRGQFDSAYLQLPREVIITALREHQRFFAVEVAETRALMPYFLAVRNGDDRNIAIVQKGSQDVLVARLEDAKFYWETDLKHSPADRVDALASVVWMEGLGSLRDKASRLVSIGAWLAGRLAPSEVMTIERAALLCKTDLLGEMIGSGKEYASLEGIIGGYYARNSGETEEVATAISEHYRPRGATDTCPASAAGALLALADKLDHVAGAFVAGKIPSGSEDPFAVRRAGNGVVRILVDRNANLDLRESTMESTRAFFAANAELPQAEIMKNLGEFWRGRVEAIVGGGEIDGAEAFWPDTVESAMGARDGKRPGWSDPYDCLLRTRVLNGFRYDGRLTSLVILFKRVANILAKATETLPATLDRARFTEAAERTLAAALDAARQTTSPLWERRAYADILPALLAMEQPIHAFFDNVMVNADDSATRLNRLRLLSEVRDLFLRGWDLSKIVVEGEKA